MKFLHHENAVQAGELAELRSRLADAQAETAQAGARRREDEAVRIETEAAHAEALATGRAQLAAAEAEGARLRGHNVELTSSTAVLARSEAYTRAILESSTDYAIIAADLEGRMTEWNSGAHNITGWERAEVLGRNVALLFTPEDRAAGASEQEMATALSEGRAQDERWHLKRDGSRFWGAGMMTLLRDDAGIVVGFLKILRDRTEPRQADAALRESEERLRALVNASSQVMYRMNPDWTEMRQLTGGGFLADMGSPNRAWLGEYIHPDDQPRLITAIQKAIRTKSTFELEHRVQRADRSFGWTLSRAVPVLDSAGEITEWFGAASDVTARKQAEEALRESEAALRRLNETLEARVAERTRERDQVWQMTSEMLCVIDFGGRFVGLNPAWAATLGWTEAEMKDKAFIGFVHPDDREATTVAGAVLARGESIVGFENRYNCKDGRYLWLSWNSEPRDGLVYAAARDVTAAKEGAEALAALEAQLQQAQKMEAVGQLTGGLAHDLNNMLQGVNGSLELAQARVREGRVADLERYLATAQGAAARAAALIHRLLAFSRRQTLNPKPVAVNRLVSGMEEMIRRTVGVGIAVETVTASGLWAVLCDPNQLENALLNLAINARDAMPDGGRLTVETANVFLDGPNARQRDVAPGQYVTMCVSDTGRGMTPDVARRAFDPFFTTKPLGKGTGLGLSMVYGFVQQSGGQVQLYSEAGYGTTVKLLLPRYDGEAEAAEAEALPKAPPTEAGETVLVVDDEPAVLMLVTEILTELGYIAVEAGDGAAALRVLRSAARVDLLVTDVGLPGGMNGRQVADAARAIRPGLKVLFITGYADAAIGNGMLEPGMQVMTKPFAMEALACKITAMIEA